ncbi:MAG: hypothetical protein HUK26_09570, partial [Duodenibacillus sp.]|nr:hypothetical protein [Duodenibacillus sp.]
MTTQYTPTPAMEKLAKSFEGARIGNIDSPVWLCGLEDAAEPSDGIFDEKVLDNPLQADELDSLRCDDWKEFWKSMWSCDGAGVKTLENNFNNGMSYSPYFELVMKVFIGFTMGEYKEEYYQALVRQADWEGLESAGILGKNGIFLLLNAFPICFAGQNNARLAWATKGNPYKVRTKDGRLLSMSEWTGLQSEPEYRGYVLHARSEVFDKVRKEKKPKVMTQ